MSLRATGKLDPARIVMMDETWINHYTLESRDGSKQWVKLGKRALKCPKTQ